MKKYKPYLTRVDLVKNQVERERIQEQEAVKKRKQRAQQQNSERWLRYQEQLRSELAARYFHGVVSAGGEADTFSNTKSLEFDGTDDYVDCGSSSYLHNLTEFSLSLWAKQPTATSTQCLIGDWNFNTSGNFALETGTVSGGATKLTFYIRINSATIRTTTTQNFVFTENVWNHIAITFNSGTLNIYVNGIAQGLNLPSLPTSLVHNDGTLDIGYFEGLGRYFSGYIDEVALFNTELSASDITNIYNGGTPNDISSLSPISWWRFEEGSGLTATDSGSGGNDGTISGATRVTDVPS